MMFYSPNNRGDADAMLNASKLGLNGLAISLGKNDKLFRLITIDPQPSAKSNPQVEITIAIKETGASV